MHTSKGKNKVGVFLAVLAVLPVFLLGAYFYIVFLMMGRGRIVPPPVMMTLQSVASIMLILTILSICVAYYIWTAKLTIPDLFKNFIISGTVFALAFLIAELVFLHYERPNGIGMRWSYKLWDKRYMQHRTSFVYTNSMGSTDRADFREPVKELTKKKKPVWFIGDSFTFGFGLEQTSQTFPALVQKLLDNQITSVNLGDGGADTYHEGETLHAFAQTSQHQPYAIVWQYFGNDIDSTDRADLYEDQLSKSSLNCIGKTLFMGRSFLLDYIYWEYFRKNETDSYRTYVDYLNRMYNTDSVVKNGKVLKDAEGYITPYRQHLKPLKEAAGHYKNMGTKFLVIIFPYLWEGGPENAEQLYASRVKKDLDKENIDAIDLTPLLKDIPLDKRVINSHDPHPSILVDQIVADTISKYFVSKYGL